MANKGQLNGKTLMSEESWTQMHSGLVVEQEMDGSCTNFTQGGVHAYGLHPLQSHPQNSKMSKKTKALIETHMNEHRSGFFGWMGLGGSVFQWHPQL